MKMLCWITSLVSKNPLKEKEFWTRDNNLEEEMDFFFTILILDKKFMSKNFIKK